MSNMSYCRFQNTRADLQDCVNALNEEDFPESRNEKEAMKSMYELCKEFVEIYEDHSEQEISSYNGRG